MNKTQNPTRLILRPPPQSPSVRSSAASSSSTPSSRSVTSSKSSRLFRGQQQLSASFFSMGLNTYQISPDLYAVNRAKLIKHLQDSHVKSAVVYLDGGLSSTRFDSDHEPVFRQESYFLYCFGVRDPDCSGLIHCDTGKTVLFVPKLLKKHATIMGRIPSLEEQRSRYGVDTILYNTDVDREEYLLNFVESLQKHEDRGENNSDVGNFGQSQQHDGKGINNVKNKSLKSRKVDGKGTVKGKYGGVKDKSIKSRQLDGKGRNGGGMVRPTSSRSLNSKGEKSNGKNDGSKNKVIPSREKYDVDNDESVKSHQSDDRERSHDAKQPTILIMKSTLSDSSKPYFPTTTTIPSSLQPYIDATTLFPILAECRVIKSQHELSLLRHVTELTSIAHVHTMIQTVPGSYEYQAEATFRYVTHYHFGARLVGYTSICACGPSAAVLRYGHKGTPNNGLIKEGNLCLHDMGAEYFGYGSDVACTFPANGVFDSRQRIIYEGVLNAQRVVIGMIKPGAAWTDLNSAAVVEVLKALIELRVVILNDGASIKNLVEIGMGEVFMPHGLGHLIGIDTYDVGGYLEDRISSISEQSGLHNVRTAKILEQNMTLTVSPGCYFIKHLIDEATMTDSLLKPYLNKEVLEEYLGFGGVRLKDVVVVTEGGCDNFTTCPRTVKEVEHVKAGGKWPPMEDDAKELKRSRLCALSPLSGMQTI